MNVVVFPTLAKPYTRDGSAGIRDETGALIRAGRRGRWHYTSDRPDDACAYCADGRCEQRVEVYDAHGFSVVVHDRPRLQ